MKISPNINKMAAALVAGLLATPTVWAQTPIVAPYCNDFETGVEGGGGSFGAQQIALVNSGDLGSGIGPAVGYGGFGHRFGGYSDVWPAGGFTASTDIYIPTTDHGLGVEENRDYSVALNRAYECDPLRQRRDYVFNWGTSPTVPGKWVISASNNAGGSRPTNNANPVLFDGGKWYQMVHVFSESPVPGPNGTKVVADMFFYERDTGILVGQWQRTNDKDLINTGTCSTESSPSFPGDVGGNRYAYFLGTGQNRPGPWVFDVDNICLSLNGSVDDTPPVIDPCVSDYANVAFDQIPPLALDLAEFQLQGGNYSDDSDSPEELVVSVVEESAGQCPIVITRTYTVTDTAGNASEPCVQTITVDNLFPEDAVLWHQPLARKGMSEDTDPGAGGTLKFGFKMGRTIPIQIHAVGCDGNVTGNSNVTGTVVVYGDTNMDGVADGNAIPIDYNGVGGAGGAMDKVGEHLKYNLDTNTLKTIADTKCYLLEVTVTDTSTGESVSEMIPVQAK